VPSDDCLRSTASRRVEITNSELGAFAGNFGSSVFPSVILTCWSQTVCLRVVCSAIVAWNWRIFCIFCPITRRHLAEERRISRRRTRCMRVRTACEVTGIVVYCSRMLDGVQRPRHPGIVRRPALRGSGISSTRLSCDAATVLLAAAILARSRLFQNSVLVRPAVVCTVLGNNCNCE